MSSHTFRVVLLATALVASFTTAGTDSRALDKQRSRWLSSEDGATLELHFTSAATLEGCEVAATLLAPNNEGLASARAPITTDSEGAHATLHLTGLDSLDSDTREELLVDRLRIETCPEGQSAAEIITLGEIAPEAFLLSVVRDYGASEDTVIRLHVLAVHPWTSEPVDGVALTLRDEDSLDDEEFLARGLTDENGRATLELLVEQRIDVELLASNRLFSTSRTLYIDTWRRAALGIVLERPVIRAGEEVRFRGHTTDQEGRPLPDRKLQASLTDPGGKTIASASVMSSRFGVFHGRFPVATDARPGRYTVHVDEAEETERARGAEAWVRVTPYETPWLLAVATPDRSYYLPGQDAEVEVSITSPDGRGIANAAVFLQRDPATGDSWGPAPVADKTEHRCTTNSSGRCTLTIGLEALHESLADWTWRKYRTAHGIVRAHDPVTGRSAERSFWLRISSAPLHVHVYELGDVSSAAPLELLIAVTEADGTPAPSTLDIDVTRSGKRPDQELAFASVKEVETNRLGMARLLLAAPPAGEELALQAVASTESGLQGATSNTLYVAKRPKPVLIPRKSLLHPGDDIVTDLYGTAEDTFAVELSRQGKLLSETTVKLDAGHASITMPYDPRFVGKLEITALAIGAGERSKYNEPGCTAGVLYHANDSLTLSLELDHKRVWPGEAVNLGIEAFRGSTPAEVSVGVLAINRAYEEVLRARRVHDPDDWFLSDTKEILESWHRPSHLATIARHLDSVDTAELTDELELGTRWELYYPFSGIETSRESLQELNELAYDGVLRVSAQPIRTALRTLKKGRGGALPREIGELRRDLRRLGADPASFLDSWGTPLLLTLEKDTHNVTAFVTSAGPDKTAHTDDDLHILLENWNPFHDIAKEYRAVCEELFAREPSGSAITPQEIKDELRKRGIDWDSLRSPLERGYEIRIEARTTSWSVTAFTRDGQVPERERSVDDFQHDAFTPLQTALRRYFTQRARLGKRFPVTETELNAALAEAALDEALFRMPTGNSVELVQGRSFEYVDLARDKAARQPATRRIPLIEIVGFDPDQERNRTLEKIRGDVFDAVRNWSGDNDDLARDGKGMIFVAARDRRSPVAGERVQISRGKPNLTRLEAATSPSGLAVFGPLEPGEYTVVLFEGEDVISLERARVEADEWRLVLVETTEPIYEEVTVISSVSLDGVLASSKRPGDSVPRRAPRPIHTPRVRRDFSDVALWIPDLEVHGTETHEFSMPDSITKWHLMAVASALDGGYATAESEFVSSLPLAVDLDLPRVLTTGDSFALPVILANDTERELDTVTELQSTAGIVIEQPQQGTLALQPRSAASTSFSLSARKHGAVRIRATTRGPDYADAVERETEVRPSGRQTRANWTQVTPDRGPIEFVVPGNTVAGTIGGKFALTPGLELQVAEMTKGLLQRPLGCTEQTASAGWLHATVLQSIGDEDSELAARSLALLKKTLKKLEARRQPRGGHAFWSDSEARAELTAWVLAFKDAASSSVPAAKKNLALDLNWLLGRQRSDGTWIQPEEERAPHQRTAFIIECIAGLGEHLDDAGRARLEKAVDRALGHLEASLAELDEPYTLAAYGIAALERGQDARARAAAERLLELATDEGTTSFWHLRVNEPLWGWGRAGRLETTALVVRLLDGALARGLLPEDAAALAERGALFLLENQDRDGGWWTTQATVQVLRALHGRWGSVTTDVAGARYRVSLDGEALGVLEAPEGPPVPLHLDLPPLAPGKHTLTVEPLDGAPRALARLILSYHKPWDAPAPTQEHVDLRVRFESAEMAAGESTMCHVHAERMNFRGYGMLLAEIGLPPGAEVLRSDLDALSEISHYELEPDRLIVYLWPRAGGTSFSFPVRLRLSGRYAAAPSRIYDYYNPDARLELEPTRFVVHPEPPAGPR